MNNSGKLHNKEKSNTASKEENLNSFIEERFRYLIEAAPDAFFHGDKGGNFILVNSKASELTGYSREELLTMNMFELFESESLSHKPLRYDLLKTGQSVRTERKLVKKNGAILDIEMNSCALPDGTYESFIRDITERKKAEKELERQKSFFEQMYLQSATSTQILDRDGWCLRINPKLSTLFGVKPEHIEGRIYNIFQDAEIIKNGIDKKLKKILEEKATLSWEVGFDIGNAAESQSIIVKEKVLKWFTNKAYPILDPNGEVEYIIIQHEDITDIKIANENLKEMLAIFDGFLKNNPLYVFIKDRDLNLVHVSDNFSKLFDVSKEKALGQSSTKYLPDDHQNFIDDIDKDVLKTNKPRTYQTQYGGKDYYSLKFPIEIDGEVKYLAGFSIDITESEQIKNELKYAKEKAEAANNAKNVFLANMSHELRTPLVGILGYSDLLMKELTPPEHLEMAKGINRTGKRLLNTLSLVLDLSRIEADKFEINRSNIDVVALLKEVFINFKGGATAKELKYELSLHAESYSLHTDPEMIQVIFNNLFSNAIKFTNSGSIHISTEIEFIAEQKYFIIKISDSGIGMKEEEIPLIFEEFRQLSEGTTRSFPGTGLGLSITRKFVDMLNGKIEVTSEPNVGTTFIIKLPDLTSD